MRKKVSKSKVKTRNMMSANLKHLRKQMKLNQKEFSELTGISVTTISNYENRKCVPSFKSIGKIAAAVGENAYMLFEVR